MDANQPLANTTLSKSLNAVCYALADTLTEGETDLTKEWLDNSLPAQVFILAIEAGWIAEPVALISLSEAVEFGGYLVSRDYEAKFLAMLDPTLSTLREIADGSESTATPNAKAISKRASQPFIGIETPKQIVYRRKREMGIPSIAKLALMARKVIEEQQFRDRDAGILLNPPRTTFSESVIYDILGNKRKTTPDSLKALATVIGCDWNALRWPK